VLELLKHYSITEIFIFICVLAIAVKGTITFFDWAYARLRMIFDKEYKQLEDKKSI